MTITDHQAAQTADYEALTPEQQDRVWRGGDVRSVSVRCDYCASAVAWAVVNGPNLRLACSNAVHIAWVESNGSACPVSAITPASGYPVDETTLPDLPPCGCPVYAETDGTFTTEHERPCTAALGGPR